MSIKQALVVYFTAAIVAAAVPANDDYADAELITSFPAVVQGNNQDATDEAYGPWWFPAGIWWKWVAPSGERVLILGSATNNGQTLVILTGDTFGEFQQVGAVGLGPGFIGYFDPTPGTTYYFCATFGVGPVQFELRPKLANDDAAGAVMMSGPMWSVSQDNSLATSEPGEEIDWYKRSLWWKWVAPTSGLARVSSAGGALQTRAFVMAGESWDALQYVEDILSGERQISVNAGATYWFRLSTPPQEVGAVRLHLFPESPPNDAFGNRATITNAAVVGTVAGATKESGEPPLLQNFESSGSVWYTWTASATGKLQVRVRNFRSDPWMPRLGLGVFQGATVGALIKRAEAQPVYPGPSTPDSEIGTTLSVHMGEVYVIGVGGGPADFDLMLDMIEAPANDHFGGAAEIPMFAELAADLSGATLEAGEPAHGSGNVASLWYRWTAPDSGWAVVAATAPKFYPQVSVYTGSVLTGLTRITNSIVAESGEVFANFFAQSGQTYQIALAAPGGVAPVIAEIELHLTTLRITNPTEGQVLAGGKPVVLAINSPNVAVEGTLASVTYIAAKTDGTRTNLVSLTNAPFSTAVTNLPTGEVFLFAHATNSDGREILSPPVQVRVRPVNDNFADATEVNSYLWEDVAPIGEATREAGEPSHGDASVWWKYRAPGTGKQRISVFAPWGVTGHLLRIYTGGSLGGLTPVVLTNEGPDRFSFNAVSGMVYHIALVVGEPHVQADLVFGIWGNLSTFTWTNPVISRLTDGTPVTLGISTTENLDEIERVEFLVGGTVVGSATSEPFQANWTPPVGYHGLAARVVKKSGPQPLELSGAVLTVIPGNDYFSERILIATNELHLNILTATASREKGEPNHESFFEGTVWYSFQATENGRLVISPTLGYPKPAAYVYEGEALATLKPGGTNMFSYAMPYSVNVGLASNRMYHIAFGGPFDGNVRFYTRPLNDSFEGRRRLRGDKVVVDAHTILTTREDGEPGFPLTNTLWWTWIAPTNGHFTLRQMNSSNWLQGAVYTGENLGELKPVRSFYNLLNPVDVPVAAGKAYSIQMGTYWGEEEHFGFEVDFKPEVLPQEFFVVAGTIGRNGRVGGQFTVAGKQNRSFRVDVSADLNTWSELGTYHMGPFEFMPVAFPSMNEPGQYFRIVPL